MNKIVLTGGGTSGHVTPNIALIEKFRQHDWQISYIGSKDGIERNLVERLQVPYYPIASGKLRRYFSWQNFIDPFKVMWGTLQSFFVLRKIKPKVIFSKGGFVSLPVVIAGFLSRIPVYIHESDISPGLANKLSYPFAKQICITFPDTEKYIKEKRKIIKTGTPVRNDFFRGDAQRGRDFCGFNSAKKIVLIMGGGQGSVFINNIVREALPLLTEFNIVHICGAGKKSQAHENLAGYIQFEYLHQELFDVMACAELIISRSGANAVCELVALKKLNILIPLGRGSRGDQIHNAQYMKKHGVSKVLLEAELTKQILIDSIKEVINTKAVYEKALVDFNYQNGTEIIFKMISETKS